MEWYWQIWLLLAYAFVAFIWKLVWINIRSRTEFIYLRFLDSVDSNPLEGCEVFASVELYFDLFSKDYERRPISASDFPSMKKIGVTDRSGCIRFRNRWLNIQQLVIFDRKKLFRYNADLFQNGTYPKEPKVLKV